MGIIIQPDKPVDKMPRIKNNLAKLKLNLNENDGHLSQENIAIKKDVEADIALLATIGLISISESDKLVDFINE